MTNTSGSGANIRETIVVVRWVLIISCAYLILFSDGSGAFGPGPFVIAAFLASNLVVGRLSQERFGTRGVKIGIAALDTVFITVSLYLSSQLSVEMLVLFLAVVVLAAVGLELGVIARIMLALSLTDILLMWLTGNALVWRSSMLLRVPFLLSAGLVYGALVEAGLGGVRGAGRLPLVAIDKLTANLVSQREAIAQCHAALSGNGSSAALGALTEIDSRNQEMQATVSCL